VSAGAEFPRAARRPLTRGVACDFIPRMVPALRGALLGAALTLLAPVVAAQQPPNTPPRSEAQERFARAVTLFEQRNYEGALAEFDRVYQLTGRADLLFNVGRTQQALGRYPEAAAAVEEYLRRSADLTAERRAEVEQLLASVRRYIAYVRLEVDPAAATLRLDGQPVEPARRAADIPLSPGRHTVDARLDGYRGDPQTVVLASGDRRVVRVALTADTADQGTLRVDGAPAAARVLVDGALVRPPTSLGAGTHAVRVEADGRAPWSGSVLVTAGAARTLRVDLARRDQLPVGWFAAAVAASGTMFALSGVFGALTLSTQDEFNGLFRGDPQVAEVASRGETLRTLTNVSIGLGAAFGAAAVVLALRTRFGAEQPSSATLAAAPGGLALRF